MTSVLMPKPDMTSIPVYDGHNDTVLNLRATGRSFFDRGVQGHIDLPRAREGGLAGGFFAVFVPDPATPPATGTARDPGAMSERVAAGTLPPPVPLADAQPYAMTELARLLRLEAESGGTVRVVRTATELRRCLAEGVFAVQLHLEGAEAIDPGMDALEVFYAAGLRSIGIVWSRPNAFAHGVPFGSPSPDTGPGLTDAGKDLVRACNRLRIMLDLSHLNEQGFWDVAAISDAPLVATHSNAHALCPSSRNLTDRQLDAIRESSGMVGVNFHVGFLRPDGQRDPDTSLEIVADHVDYLVERLGPDKVGFGSDFDGATMPAPLGDAAGLPRLLATLQARGYDDATLTLLAHENWLRVLEQTWGA